YNNTEGRPDAASGSTTNDTWVHYDCVFYADGCTAVYVDGELVSIVAQSDGFDLSLANCIGEDSTFYVGYAAWGEYFSGSLKNLVVYSTAIYEHDDSTKNLDGGISISGTEISILSVIDDGNGTWGGDTETTSDHVFDGDTSTYYDGAVEEAWVGCTFESTVISTVLVYARTDLYERMNEAEIQGSNDGESWTTLYTISEEENTAGQWIVCDITDTTAYTYLRIYGCGYGNVAEMKLYAATDDSAGYTLVSGAEVSILSVIDDGNGTWDDDTERTSDHVFDGDTSTYYDGAAEDAWVGCTFDSTVISAVAVYARSDNYERVNGAEIQGSNDGESWTTLYTISEEENTAGQWVVCEITDTTAYTYLRIYGCEYGNVAEMRIYTAYGVTDGLVGYYTLTSDLSNSVEGGSDGSAVGHMFGDTEGDANFTDGSFHTTNGVNDGAVFTADITDDFTVSFTVSVDWYVFAAPILWIGSQDQSSENWIGIWCDFNESYGPSVGSNGSEGYRIGVMGGTSVGVTYPVTDLIITLVVEDGVAYLYYDGVLVGQSNDPENGAFQTDGNNGTDLTTSSMPNPWTAEDCAIYLGVNAGDESATAAYSDLYIYNRALTAEEVAEIATPVIYGSSCGDNLSWTLEDGTLTISGTGDMYNYEWGTSPWRYISNKITSIVIEDGVTFICGGAFSDCTNLTEIIVDEGNEAYCSADGVLFSKDMTTLISCPAGKTETSYDIPDGVTTLDWGAFFGCASLESVTIPDSVEWIDDWAFACCTSLSSVTIPDSVTFICGGTFEHCESLTSITIPGSVTYISSLAFGNCQSLGEITFEGDAPYIEDNAFEGVGATAYYPYGNDTWTEDVMQDYGGSITWLTVLESGICGDEMTWTLTSDGTLTISGTGEMYDFDEETAPWYLYRESITTVVFEDGVTSIGMYAFYNCTSLESITIPESVTSIDYMAFYNCSSLTEITFKGDAPGFGEDVFYGVTATAYYPASNDTWTEDVMQDYGGSITWVAVTESGVCGDNLTWMLTSDGTLIISGTGDMYDYEHIEDEDNNYGTAPWFSYFDSITSVIIGDGVTSIGSFAFFGCYNMTGITIPDSVTWIGDYAFQSTSLTSVTIPAGVNSIGYGVFAGCTSLTEINVDENNTVFWSVDGVLFDGGEETTLVAYPAGKTDTSYVVPDGVVSISNAAFDNCANLESVTFPESLSWIGDWAFDGQTGVTEITFKGDARGFGENAFYYITATAYYPAGNETWTEDVMQDYGGTITWVAYGAETSGTSGTCGDNLTWTLEDGTLTISGTGEMYDYDEFSTPWNDYSDSITSVVIEEGVTAIGSYAFSGMSIESITIPDGVTSIGNSVFYGCTALSSVTIPDSVEYIGEGAFSCCTSLESIIIPAGVTVIAGGAFSCSDGLTEITFEGDAPSIGDYAFDYVTATVYYPASSSTWTEDVMQDYGYGTITWVAYTAYGTCGDDLTWVLSDGVLTISG
ncbi:MAG: leucine-rich repeat protein, partial [Firmicutes bacterium]|nr:leucine-rich repeat protein [Bacillota bacterium]